MIVHRMMLWITACPVVGGTVAHGAGTAGDCAGHRIACDCKREAIPFPAVNRLPFLPVFLATSPYVGMEGPR